MSKVEFELDLKGLNELMKSPEMQKVLDEKADEVIQNAGGKGYDKRTHVADFVAISNIFPTEKKTTHDTFENNSLLKALYNAKK